MRIIINLFRAFSILAIGVLIGYYDFQIIGYMGVITNFVYFMLGMLLVTTWKRVETKNSELTYLIVQDDDEQQKINQEKLSTQHDAA